MVKGGDAYVSSVLLARLVKTAHLGQLLKPGAGMLDQDGGLEAPKPQPG